jgi:hypothetical protein
LYVFPANLYFVKRPSLMNLSMGKENVFFLSLQFHTWEGFLTFNIKISSVSSIIFIVFISFSLIYLECVLHILRARVSSTINKKQFLSSLLFYYILSKTFYFSQHSAKFSESEIYIYIYILARTMKDNLRKKWF